MHVKEVKGAEVHADFSCETNGKACDLNNQGHKSKVSMWFNGSRLVVLETQGDEITRRRFQTSGNADTLNVEVAPMSSRSKIEKLTFVRESGVGGAP